MSKADEGTQQGATFRELMNRAGLFWAACAGIFIFGIVLAMLGVLFGLPQMRERLDINLVQQGDVLLALFFGVLLSTVISGPVIDSRGNKVVLAVSALLVTAGLLFVAGARSFPAAAASALLLGFGGGGLNNSTNALIADLYPENRGAMLNALGTFFGAGALALPLSVAVMAETFTIPQMLVGAACLSGALTILYSLVDFPRPAETVGFSILASVRVGRLPGVLLFAGILFCQSGNESSIGGWTSTYLGTLGASPRAATLVLSCYWGALMLGRAVGARLLRAVSKPRIIIMGAIGSVVGCGSLLAATSIPVLAAAAAMTGLSFATIYPTVLAIAADRYQRIAGTIFGFLFATGLIGGMLFPWSIGQISHAYGVRAGMIVPLAGTLAVALLAVRLSVAAVTPVPETRE